MFFFVTKDSFVILKKYFERNMFLISVFSPLAKDVYEYRDPRDRCRGFGIWLSKLLLMIYVILDGH